MNRRVTGIRAVAWDLSGVITVEPDLEPADFFTKTGLDRETWDRVFWDYAGGQPWAWPKVEKGELTLVEFCEELCRRLEQVGGHCTPEVMADVWGKPNPFVARPEVRPRVFDLIRGVRGLPHVLCTNNIAEWRSSWHPMVPLELFSKVFDSSDVGLRKPEPEYWELVEKYLRCEPSQILFFDDMKYNIDCARERGWNAVLFADVADAENALREFGIHVEEESR